MKPLLVFSPLPPARSGVADYCLAQLPHLARTRQVTVVVSAANLPSIDRDDPRLGGVSLISELAWAAHAADFRASAKLFHVGNSIYHEHVVWACEREYGVIFLHDFSLHHLQYALTAARGDWEGYRRALAANQGALAQDMVTAARAFDPGLIQFIEPMHVDLLREARGVVVHSLWAKGRLRGEGIRRVQHLPHPYFPPVDLAADTTRSEARRELGLPDAAFVLASLGTVTAQKQIGLVLRALSSLSGSLGPFRYLVVGDIEGREELEREIRERSLSEHVTLTGYVSLESLHTHIAACDAVINLRYPYAGESSGVLMRALGMGRPALVFDYGAFADYPDGTVYKISLDTDRTDALEQAILALKNPALAEAMGAAARRYVASECDLERVTDALLAFIDAAYADPSVG